ncbi:hypothetical protein [Kitasatospora sp. NPDC002965]|uniref:hypothetical protein n=1 Tax=Kitasatospora sp. NPDC002965 TaxID=3154775 RepID=UPI0033BE3ABE
MEPISTIDTVDTVTTNDAARLLADAEGLRARTRTRLSGSGVPLLLFGTLALLAVPVARHAFNFGSSARSLISYPAFAYAELTGLCVSHSAGGGCEADEFLGSAIRFLAWGTWYAVLPLTWLGLSRWYRLRGEERGVVPHRAGWLGPVALGSVAVLGVLLLLITMRRQSLFLSLLGNNYASPWYLVGIGLVALGVVERNRVVAFAGLAHALLLTAYLAAPWGSSLLPWVQTDGSRWIDGPQPKALLLAAILLAAGTAQWRAARTRPAGGGASSTVTA